MLAGGGLGLWSPGKVRGAVIWAGECPRTQSPCVGERQPGFDPMGKVGLQELHESPASSSLMDCKQVTSFSLTFQVATL